MKYIILFIIYTIGLIGLNLISFDEDSSVIEHYFLLFLWSILCLGYMIYLVIKDKKQ